MFVLLKVQIDLKTVFCKNMKFSFNFARHRKENKIPENQKTDN